MGTLQRITINLVLAATSCLLALPAAAQGNCPPGAGHALGFDGVNDRVDCGGFPAPVQHTIEAWVRIPENPSTQCCQTIAGQVGLASGCGRGARLRFNGALVYYELNNAGCGSGGGYLGDASTEPGVWHHYAGTYDGLTMRFYRDGALIGDLDISWNSTYNHFYIGAHNDSALVDQYKGDVDEVRLWNYARPPADIAADVNRCLTGLENGLIGYWPIDEGMGTTTTDLSPGNHPGTIVGAQWIQQSGCFTAYCFGDSSCPCGNSSAPAGCANSTGVGALLDASGSPSVSSDDLVLMVSDLPPNQNGILFMGAGQTCAAPFGDGLLCVSPGPAMFCRFPVQNSGPGGEMTEGPGIVAFSLTLPQSCHIDPGETWNFQGWYRDPQGPCGQTFNLSNAFTVTFVP